MELYDKSFVRDREVINDLMCGVENHRENKQKISSFIRNNKYFCTQ
ncbi:MAG: hypothetical protein EZS26_001953 [Candidatus Ordinivivax streblomastigis]|uniref:Uncharacterized protein n=1 Tax=Candidatus Ordinivivax streblomastigis TaxID=2540710 RepID=A0A5M8P0T3_9BACT|nr:MAG: hypothetical protein EZS26_001953 [Candidatus Ordinivivax streblomastigis]